jgi:NADH-quinone oxidoreductase subunit J
VALAAVAAVGAVAGWFVYHGRSAFHVAAPAYGSIGAGGAGNTERVADALFQDYLLPFELASVLLLVAVVGSVLMAKKRI